MNVGLASRPTDLASFLDGHENEPSEERLFVQGFCFATSLAYAGRACCHHETLVQSPSTGCLRVLKKWRSEERVRCSVASVHRGCP